EAGRAVPLCQRRAVQVRRAAARARRRQGAAPARLRRHHRAGGDPGRGGAVGRQANRAGEHLMSSPSSLPLTVIIPVYNEAENLRGWYREAAPHLPPGTQVKIVYAMADG